MNTRTATTILIELDTPNLQPLLSTTIESGEGCLVAVAAGVAADSDGGSH